MLLYITHNNMTYTNNMFNLMLLDSVDSVIKIVTNNNNNNIPKHL